MVIVEEILKHPCFIKYMNLNAEAEKNREFCVHDLQHALDVARVAYIMALEKNMSIRKEIIYAAALLHDTAKWKQYRDGTDHAEESAITAEEILRDIGTDKQDREIIVEAIRCHRRNGSRNSELSEILYKSDKTCRPCIMCRKINECNRFTDHMKPELKY